MCDKDRGRAVAIAIAMWRGFEFEHDAGFSRSPSVSVLGSSSECRDCNRRVEDRDELLWINQDVGSLWWSIPFSA